MKPFKIARTTPALALAGLLAVSTTATAAPITIGSQNFDDVDDASSTTVDFNGSGIPTDPVAWSSFTDGDRNELILGLGTHGRHLTTTNVTTSESGQRLRRGGRF